MKKRTKPSGLPPAVRLLVLVLVLAAFGVAISACGSGSGVATSGSEAAGESSGGEGESESSGGEGEEAGGAAEPTAGGEEGSGGSVTVGVVTDTSGPIAPYGHAMLNGLELAVDQVNEAGGVDGKTIKLQIYNTASNFNAAGPLFLKLAADPKVVAVLGPNGSPYLSNSAALIAKAKTPAIAPTSADEFPAGVLSKWTFRTAPIEGPAFPALVEGLQKAHPFKTLAIVTDPTNPLSVSEQEELEKLAPQNGYEVVDTESAPESQTDFSTMVTKLQGADPDVIWNSLVTEGAAALMKQAREVGLESTFMGGATLGDSPEIFELAAGAGAGAYTFVAFDAESEEPAVKEFVKQFESAYGEEPENQSALSYVAANVLVEAMKEAGVEATGQKERDAIQAALANLHYESIAGPITYEGGPDNTTPQFLIVKANEEGKLEVVSKVEG
jgi:branched-chain amino acid transport system substrate-binding protein